MTMQYQPSIAGSGNVGSILGAGTLLSWEHEAQGCC